MVYGDSEFLIKTIKEELRKLAVPELLFCLEIAADELDLAKGNAKTVMLHALFQATSMRRNILFYLADNNPFVGAQMYHEKDYTKMVA